ncbi:MAG: hypothetical protein AB7F96_07960 [Beijerinckiaceae bacterium]
MFLSLFCLPISQRLRTLKSHSTRSRPNEIAPGCRKKSRFRLAAGFALLLIGLIPILGRTAIAQTGVSLQGTCLQLAPMAAEFAKLREAGKSEVELGVLLRRAGGPLILHDIMTWMVKELYSTLRYVPPNEVASRVETMCRSKFK